MRTAQEIHELGGVGFDDIRAEPIEIPGLPLYLPQVRNRSSLSGFLSEQIYALRAKDVVKARAVLPAAEIRRRLGLQPRQLLVLLLFDTDEVLEDMWERSGPLIWQIAEAGYDAVVAPSFSTYVPRPRTEFMINTRRSMLYFQALLKAGVGAIPRLAWQVSADARRFGQWILANPCVELVALDWSTYRSSFDWRGQLEGLAIVETMTKGRLTYLINGATTEARCSQVFGLVPPSRVCITNATTQARIAPRRLRPVGDQTGVSFSPRCAVRRGVVERASVQAEHPARRRDQDLSRAA
jgi:hypothetical protein